ncbi:MAG: ATP-binding cassette domain-containing protein [Acidimicrobiia bacterium]|nr:ATP-binding cassette domain-containing protein [Acidimicrobiia bacterium]
MGETGCGKSVTARSFLRLVPMPPGIPVSGSIIFRPRQRCSSCDGAGCPTCAGTGRVVSPCPVCAGSGCDTCEQSGAETIDLLTIPERELRSIRGNRIAMIFQDPGKALNPALSIRKQVAEVFYAHRSDELLVSAGIDPGSGSMPTTLLRRRATQQSRTLESVLLSLPPLRSGRTAISEAADDRVATALAETQIPNPRAVMDRYPHELSGGMKQRVMIAMALACDPDLLIADEPTTALDVTVQARIIELIKELQQRHKTAVVYISHDLSLVRKVADRTAVMYAGRIVEVGDSEQIFHEPEHPYTRGLIDAIPGAHHERGRLAAIEGTVPELIDPEPSCRFAGRCDYAASVCWTHDPTLGPVRDREVACFIHHPPEHGEAPSFDRTVR